MGYTKSELIVHNPKIQSGEPVFRGTRVPARILLEYLEEGVVLDEFLDDFPSVSREQAEAAIRLMQDYLLAPA